MDRNNWSIAVMNLFIFFALLWILGVNCNNLSRENYSLERVDNENGTTHFHRSFHAPRRFRNFDYDKAITRIVNGKPARIRDHPFIVYILMCTGPNNCTMCGGSILTRKTVVTAAHCINDKANGNEFKLKTCSGTIFYGHKRVQAGTQVDFKCERHGKLHNELDIAVITLPKKQKFRGSVYRTVRIGTPEMTPPVGANVMVAGWGRTSFNPVKQPDVLQEVGIHIEDNRNCSRYPDFKPDKEICAAKPEEGKDSCNGDSGGPLECFTKNKKKYLCGIVSRGPTNCGSFYGIYVSVTHKDMVHWLKKNGKAKTYEKDKAKRKEGSKKPKKKGKKPRKRGKRTDQGQCGRIDVNVTLICLFIALSGVGSFAENGN